MELNRMTANTKLSGYLPIPLDLLQTGLSSTAILLYGLLLDRGSLSQKNDYTDFGGWIYVVYAREDLAHTLGISTRMVTRYLQDLENMGLLRRVRRSRKEGNRYFLSVPEGSDRGTGEGSGKRTSFPEEKNKTSSGTGRKIPPNHLRKPPDTNYLYHCSKEESL